MIKTVPKGQTGNLLTQYAFTRLLGESLGYACSLHPVPGFNLDTSIPGMVTDPVECVGYYEQSELYEDFRPDIYSWFGFDEKPYKNRLAIHVRGGDAALEDRCAPYEYYEQAIAQSSGSDPVIYSDDPDNSVCLKLARKFHIPVKRSDPIVDFHEIRNSSHIIIGNSTFAWWAAFLSLHNNVTQPEPLKGWRSRSMPQKCLIVDEWKQIPY